MRAESVDVLPLSKDFPVTQNLPNAFALEQALPIPEHVPALLQTVLNGIPIAIAVSSFPINDPREWRPILDVASKWESLSAGLDSITLQRVTLTPEELGCPGRCILKYATTVYQVVLHGHDQVFMVILCHDVVESPQLSSASTFKCRVANS